jgi:hypothetical protein
MVGRIPARRIAVVASMALAVALVLSPDLASGGIIYFDSSNEIGATLSANGSLSGEIGVGNITDGPNALYTVGAYLEFSFSNPTPDGSGGYIYSSGYISIMGYTYPPGYKIDPLYETFLTGTFNGGLDLQSNGSGDYSFASSPTFSGSIGSYLAEYFNEPTEGFGTLSILFHPFTSSDGNLSDSIYGETEFDAVPEPPSATLTGIGVLAGFIAWRRRSR